MDYNNEINRLEATISLLKKTLICDTITKECLLDTMPYLLKANAILYSILVFVVGALNKHEKEQKQSFESFNRDYILKGYAHDERKQLWFLSCSEEYRDLLVVKNKLMVYSDYLKGVSFQINTALNLFQLEQKVSGGHY